MDAGEKQQPAWQDGETLRDNADDKEAEPVKAVAHSLSESAHQTDQDGEASSGEDGAPQYIEGYGRILLLGGVTVVLILAMMDITILSTITTEFHRLEDVAWYVGAYQLASAAVQPLTGKLYQNLALKWTFLFFFLVFEVGSAVCGSASSSTIFIIGRAIAGIGTSGLVNGALTIFAAALPVQMRPMYTGISLGFAQLGIVGGPLIGGALTQETTWRWCFYINLPLGAVAALLLIIQRVPEQMPKDPLSLSVVKKILFNLDLVGFALLAPAACMLLLALQYGASQEFAWTSSVIIGLFVGSGVTAIVFLVWEYFKGDDAMLPFSIITHRVVWTSSLNYGFLMSTVVMGSNFLSIYFQSVKGLGAVMAGVYLLPSMLSQVIFIIASGALVTRLGFYMPWALGGTALAVIGLGLISTWSVDTSLGMIIGDQILFGARGAVIQMGIIAIQTNIEDQGKATLGQAFLVFCQNLFSAIFITIGNVIFQETLKSGVEQRAPSIDPDAVVAAGSSHHGIQSLAPEGSDAMHGILVSYADAFDNVVYVMLALAFVAFFASFGMGWVDLRKKKEPEKSESA